MAEARNGWLVSLRVFTPLMIGILLAQYNIDHQTRRDLQDKVDLIELRLNHDITEVKQRLSRLEVSSENMVKRMDGMERLLTDFKKR